LDIVIFWFTSTSALLLLSVGEPQVLK